MLSKPGGRKSKELMRPFLELWGATGKGSHSSDTFFQKACKAQ